MTSLRSSRASGFRALLALLYVLLGVSAAWHAPHVLPSNHAVVSDARGAAPSSAALSDDACALCAWQSLSQEAAASPAAAPSFLRISVADGLAPAAPAGGWFLAQRARGPPAFS